LQYCGVGTTTGGGGLFGGGLGGKGGGAGGGGGMITCHAMVPLHGTVVAKHDSTMVKMADAPGLRYST
jgi:hypothetical protein